MAASGAAFTAAIVACSGGGTAGAPSDAGSDDATLAVFDAGPPSSQDASEDAGGPPPPCPPYDASALTDAEIQAGAAIVSSKNCAHCHGPYLEGSMTPLRSTNAAGGVAYAPNLTPDPGDGLGCWSDSQIERAVLYGIDNRGDALCSPMPRWGELSDGGIDEAGAAEVTAYLRTLLVVLNPSVPATGPCAAAGDEDAGGTPPDASLDASTTDAAIDATIDAMGDAASDASLDADALLGSEASDDGG